MIRNLRPLTPLMERSPRLFSLDNTRLAERSDFALASVQFSGAASGRGSPAALKKIIGHALPEPGRMAASPKDNLIAIWMRPDCYLLMATGGSISEREPQKAFSRAALQRLLAEKLRAGSTAITDQSDGWCAFDLQAPTHNATQILALLTPIDPAGFTPDSAVATAIEHISCIVLCHEPGEMTFLGPRSSAESLWHAITTACAAAVRG